MAKLIYKTKLKEFNGRGILVLVSILIVILTHLIPWMMGGLPEQYVTLHIWTNMIAGILIIFNVKV